MAYDEELTSRFREALGGLPGVSEKKMMGGVCFLLDGNMVGGADRTRAGEGRFMFRVGRDNEDEALAREGAWIMEQGGRRMSGLVFVSEDACDDDALKDWVSLALSFVTTLPPKWAVDKGTVVMTSASLPGFSAETLEFLETLKANNTRDWFQANKAVYERAVKQPAEAFSAEMACQLEDLTGIAHKPKVFRIHRDVRFSKDKTPYNAHIRISFSPMTDRDDVPPAWFFGFQPGHWALGTGVFAFEKRALERFRDRVAGEDGAALEKLLGALKKKKIRLSDPDLKRVPTGWPQDHARADLLRHKGLAAWIDREDVTAIRPGMVKSCMSDFTRLKPLFDWLLESSP